MGFFGKVTPKQDPPAQLRQTDWGGEFTANVDGPAPEKPAVAFGPRRRNTNISIGDSLTIDSVYRCASILSTLMGGLEIQAVRKGRPLETQPALIRRPELDNPRRVTIMTTTLSLALAGEAFWYLPGRTSSMALAETLQVVDPRHVSVRRDPSNGVIEYSVYDMWTGKWAACPSWQIQHLKLLRLPGALHGLGPIQACQATLRGALDLTDYAGNWFADGKGTTDGVLKTDQVLTAELSESYRSRWTDLRNQGGVAVLGSGLDFQPSMLSPRDALWIEAQGYDAVKVARMFGIPATLLDANFQTDAATYANQSQRNLDLLQYTLSAYIGEIECAFSECLPSTTKAQFDTGGLTKVDTDRRYAGYVAMVGAGIFTVDEVREREGMDPLSETQATATLPPVNVPLKDGSNLNA